MQVFDTFSCCSSFSILPLEFPTLNNNKQNNQEIKVKKRKTNFFFKLERERSDKKRKANEKKVGRKSFYSART